MDKERKILEKLGIDALFLTDYFNKRYFTGFTGTTGQALATKDIKYFYSDFRYIEQATEQTKPYGYEFYQIDRRAIDILVDHIKKHNIKRLGFDDAAMSVSEYNIYKEAFKGVELVPASAEMLEVRKIKSQKEIENLRRAAEISDIAFKEVVKIIKEGITEREIAAYILL